MLTGVKRLRHYLQKHALYPAQIDEAPHAKTRMIVAIPCYNEPDVTTTLSSLWACDRPSCAVEVLLVLNASEHAPAAAHEQNAKTLRELEGWATTHTSSTFRFHALSLPNLPAKHAGVGLARKVGLDEAVRRFVACEQDGILINLDADCEVAPNYFTAIEDTFAQEPQPAGACIYFEHPLHGELPDANYRAIAQYELHLRYFVQGLRVAEHPCDFHTVGSCIALPSQIYARIGGMNKRRGGEDFYFLQKLAQHGHLTNTNATCVRPDARLSDRNPFGTGPALTQMLDGQEDEAESHYLTYHPETFHILRQLHECCTHFYYESPESTSASSLQLDPHFAMFLEQQKWTETLATIKSNTATFESFAKRFYHWFNGFLVVKWAHFYRDAHAPNIPVEEAALALLPKAQQPNEPTLHALLQAYRDLDRHDHRSN